MSHHTPLYIAAMVLALLSPFAYAADPNEPINVDDYHGTIRVACVGDSITAGVGAEAGQSYPSQLGHLIGSSWEVKNFGVSGATIGNHGDKPYQKEKAMKSALGFLPNVVIIMLGTNDTKPQNWKHKDSLEADYKDLIAKFAALRSKPRIYICRPVPVAGKGNFGINEEGVLAEAKIVDKVAKDCKIGLIDLHAPLKDHPEMLPDSVHPNSAGAAEMAKAVEKALIGKK
jgi:lysophospholipase L1-like esterase